MSDTGEVDELLSASSSRLQDAASRLNVRSALNPMLWLSGTMTPVLLGAAVLFALTPGLEGIANVLGYVALVLPLSTAGIGVYLAIAKPEKLQSEEFQIRQQALTVMQMGAAAKRIDLASIVAIANPAATRPPEGRNS